MDNHSEKIVVRYAETDQMGIVHHSNYPVWFEVARTGFIKSMGMPYSEVERQGLLMPLSECNVQYKAGAFYEDVLTVAVRIEKLTGARVVFYYEVTRDQDKALIALGTTMHGFTNRSLKVLNILKTHPAIYDLLHRAWKE